jgi:broad specificity phosphatase PhoE
VGRAQALALGVHLQPETFSVAVTSDLRRAVETAEAICAGRDLTLECDPGLREMLFGEWEGLTWDEIVARSPDIAYTYEKSPRNYTPAGGETFAALCERVGTSFRKIAARIPAGERALLVSHAGVMHAILHVILWAQGGDAETESLGVTFRHASIMRIELAEDGAWRLTRLNETADVLDSARTAGG